MAKLTKTQITHVQKRLEALHVAKITLLETKLPYPETVSTIQVGLKWAQENPTKFVNMLAKLPTSKHHVDLCNIYKETPAVKRAKAKYQQAMTKRSDRISNATRKLIQEMTDIMDDLYFAHCDDAKAAIARFEKLSV